MKIQRIVFKKNLVCKKIREERRRRKRKVYDKEIRGLYHWIKCYIEVSMQTLYGAAVKNMPNFTVINYFRMSIYVRNMISTS